MVSVVICSYNREKFLPGALNSLINQTVDKDKYEVIIVNNNSTDSTEKICKQFISENKELNVSYFVEKNQGLSFARNRGIKEAKGEIISFIDDDAIAREDYVENLIKTFKQYPEYGAIGGKVIPIFPDNKEPVWMSKYIQGVVSKVDYGNKIKDFSKKYPTGCNMAFRRELFEKFGGFNTDLVYRGDDKYVFYKLKKNKVKILYAPNVYVNHNIDAYRIEPKFIDKISKSTGASEKLRLQTEPGYKSVYKLLEYFYKLSGAVVLYFMFLIKGQPQKGKYCVKVMYHTILGFFKEKKFAQL
ncbi:MAG: hypothetical protein DRJ01_02965 [Bacteroidetes bacterium]|nr:MAG: hypothetical protein DRJ01_02965 [Bacteroidota bacterium]